MIPWEASLERVMRQATKSSATCAKNHSMKISLYHSVSDIMKMHWLYCLQKAKKKTLSNVAKQKYECSICNWHGHTYITCPLKLQQTNQ